MGLSPETCTKSLGGDIIDLRLDCALRRDAGPETLRLPKLATRLTPASLAPDVGSEVRRCRRFSVAMKLSSSSRPCGVVQNESMVVERKRCCQGATTPFLMD